MKDNSGIWAALSRGLNCKVFGDCSERTVSQRTAIGFKRLLGLSMSDQNAVHIVHVAMLGSAYLIFNKEKQSVGGVGLVLLLTVAYQIG